MMVLGWVWMQSKSICMPSSKDESVGRQYNPSVLKREVERVRNHVRCLVVRQATSAHSSHLALTYRLGFSYVVNGGYIQALYIYTECGAVVGCQCLFLGCCLLDVLLQNEHVGPTWFLEVINHEKHTCKQCECACLMCSC